MKVTVQDLYKSYGGRDIFQNFSLDIDSGMRLCVCGPNGVGKTTFLRMLAGTEQADAGRILMPKECRLGYVEQELAAADLQKNLLDFILDILPDWSDFWHQWHKASEDQDEATLNKLIARQNELEGIYGYNPEHKAKAVLSGLGFATEKWSMTLEKLSGGWRERAKLARILTAGADVLLLDEPTNHLDLEAVEWLENFLAKFKGTLIFIAHDRVFMDSVASHVLYLGYNKPLFRKGNYSNFFVLQAAYEEAHEREAKILQEELKRKQAFVERFRAKATKARQAASRQKMAKKIEKELEESYQPIVKQRELNFSWPKPPHAEKTVIAADKMAFHFQDGKTMWPPLTFSVGNGQRIALVGHNGCGKSTLIKLLAGQLAISGGQLTLGQQARLGYYSQHQMETLEANNSVLAEMRRLCENCTEEELMGALGLFLLNASFFERPVDSLSGGEKVRLVLASLFLKRCNILLLDEPTNHLDLESREALQDALQKFTGTLIVIVHDRWLLANINTEIWHLQADGIHNYADYNAYLEAQKATSNKSITNTAKNEKNEKLEQVNKPTSREDQKRLKREDAARRNALYRKLQPLQEKYLALEKELELCMSEQAEVEQQLANPETYANKGQYFELNQKFNTLNENCNKLMEDMGLLEQQIQEIQASNA